MGTVPDQIPDQKYAEDFLNSLHTAYTENQEQRKKVFGERKQKVRSEGLDDNLLPTERIVPPPEAAGPSTTGVTGGAGPSTNPDTDASTSTA